jgi:hypothetical protein
LLNIVTYKNRLQYQKMRKAAAAKDGGDATVSNTTPKTPKGRKGKTSKATTPKNVSDDEDDEPESPAKTPKGRKGKTTKATTPKHVSDDEEDEPESPAKTPKGRKGKTTKATTPKTAEDDENDEPESPVKLPKKRATPKRAKSPAPEGSDGRFDHNFFFNAYLINTTTEEDGGKAKKVKTDSTWAAVNDTDTKAVVKDEQDSAHEDEEFDGDEAITEEVEEV